MQDLRLIGVHEDGQHLLLADADGGRFRLSLDEALRAAARRDRPRLGQLQIEIEGGLRPRDVQALIRRGLSAEEVADRAGWTVEKVRRFEGPVLAEREHVAQRARQCAVGSRGSGPVTLAERVAERLKGRGVDRDGVTWDSSRDEDGVWSLTMTFPAGGRQRTATWRYEPLGGSVTAADDEARWLSEESAPGVIPTPHPVPSAGDLDVYDIDADGGLGRARQREPHEPIDLMAAMREHSTRGRRSRRRTSSPGSTGEERPHAQALPIEDLAPEVDDTPSAPTARGRHPAGTQRPGRGTGDGPGWADETHPPSRTRDRSAPPPVRADAGDPPERAPQGAPRPAPRGTRPAPAGGGIGDDADDARPPGPARRGRPSVPSWDDIVFGTRGGGPA
jgi:hypothetical protein